MTLLVFQNVKTLKRYPACWPYRSNAVLEDDVIKIARHEFVFKRAVAINPKQKVHILQEIVCTRSPPLRHALTHYIAGWTDHYCPPVVKLGGGRIQGDLRSPTSDLRSPTSDDRPSTSDFRPTSFYAEIPWILCLLKCTI